MIAQEAKDRICSVLCRSRKLSDAVLKAIVMPSDDELRLYDCAGWCLCHFAHYFIHADLTSAGFEFLSVNCSMLRTLELMQCGSLSDSVCGTFTT